MEVTVLGPVTVDGAGVLGRRDRVVLAVLVSRPGLQVTPDTLADAMWGDAPPASATKNLQGCVVRLRRLLGPEGIATSAFGYSFTLAPEDVDAWRFQRLVDRARELLALGEPDRASYQLGQALGLWRGEPFVDLEAWPPAGPVVRRLGELRQEAEELNAEAGLAAGRVAEVLATCQTLVREAPLRERRWALLARAQYQAGQQAEALRTIHHLKGVLARQLGIDPSPDLMALEQAILQQDPDLAVPETAAGEPVDTCPWPGLQAYDVEDADWFFGRESEVADCLEVLRTRSLLAVAGPSGSGKSSLLRAGVGAALRARGQRLVVITPGPRPMDALSALSGTTRDTVLVVDQAEEVFTLCHDEDEQRTFLDSLVDEAERRTLLVALRADRLSDVSGHTDLSRLVERGLYLVGRLREEGLREAIEKPARQAGLLVEPGLVDLLVVEVARDPGALPLLSHALQETWRRREGRTLTVAGYRDSGGINGAVAQSAERLYAALDPAERDDLRELMLRLVMPDREGDPVPAKVPRRTLATDSELEGLAERLVAARLVTSDDEMLSVSHEALARAWPRLRGWLEDDVDGQRILHHLAATADGWDALGRPETELYRGVRLARALAWQDQRHASPNPVETDFLAASREAEQVAERSAAEHARRQTVLIRRLRLVLAGAVVLLVLALVAGGFAAVQSDRAARNAAEARQAALSADARRVSDRAQLTDDISLSLLLAAAGARLDDSPETRVNLMDALAERPNLVRSALPGGGYLELLSVSPDGRWIASSDDRNRMHLYDAATSQLLRSYDAGRPAENGQAFTIGAFSPDSSQLAVTLTVGDSTEPVRLLDPDTMRPTRKLVYPGRPAIGLGVQFSADGRYLAATVFEGYDATQGAETRGYAVLWDLRSLSTPPVRIRIGETRQGLALSPDGQTVSTGWPLTAYDVATGKRVWRRPDVHSFVLDLNSQGTLLALQDSTDEETKKDPLLVDPATGETVHTLRGHQDTVMDIRFSPDGSLVGSVSFDGELIVWDPVTGRPLDRWHTSAPWGVGFGPDNDLVYGGGGDGSMLRTWDLSMEDTYLQQTTEVDGTPVFTHADFSPDGKRVAYRWVDDAGQGWVRFVDTTTGEATTPTELPTQSLAWSFGTWRPDGGRYVGWCALDVCPETGVVTVVDPTTGEIVDKKNLLDQDIYSLAYVDGGRRMLVGSADHKSSLFDAETLLPEDDDVGFAVDSSTRLGDGSTLMVFEDSLDGGSQHWRVVDVNTGELLSEGDVDVFQYASVASPDGSTVAVAGDTGEIVTIDVSSGGGQRRSTSLGAGVRWLDYSDDGELLVSAAEDGGASLWDASTLDRLGTVYPPHSGTSVPAGAQFIGDTHDVAIASYDGRVYRWETDLDRALDFACQMAGRNLTEDEWAGLLPDQPYRDLCPGL